MEFCILTQPMDLTRRNDQLLLRMFSAEPPRPVFTHIAFHLPIVPMDRMPLCAPGKTYGQKSGTQIHVLGKKLPDGSVTWSGSYRVEVANGPSVMLVGLNLLVEEVEARPVDVLILSPRNPEAVAIVRRVNPRLVVIDEAFVCQSHPKLARVTLRDLHALQRALQPANSILLAPGESWTVTAGK
jgi:hypothetical protein